MNWGRWEAYSWAYAERLESVDGPEEAGWDEDGKAAVVAAREEDDDVGYGVSHT